ncbi:MAG TPA: ribonuclease HII [Candidatus Saccharimonadales bacterium]|nr:ribonuclease HII [Candidatus Saccharimonadales bacterium]
MITLGIDEVGRGCLAGPLVVGAVVLTQPIKGLKDSKLLSKVQRQRLVPEIKLLSEGYALGWVSASEIDNLGLTKATELAIERALVEIKVDYDEIVIDGNYNFLKDNPKSRSLIKADNLVPAVSAASVLAKCARDQYMREQARIFPEYGFDKHVGYGTAYHIEKLQLLGLSSLHRRTFKVGLLI